MLETKFFFTYIFLNGLSQCPDIKNVAESISSHSLPLEITAGSEIKVNGTQQRCFSQCKSTAIRY